MDSEGGAHVVRLGARLRVDRQQKLLIDGDDATPATILLVVGREIALDAARVGHKQVP